MKKVILLFGLLLSAASMMAQPILVGHRGSGYGVESSEEAFRRGQALGYEYVESDIKVTKDKRIVLSHDDDLSRLAGRADLTIAGSTLEQLQSVTLTQTRSGVTYTGKIMSLDEWLDLCAELRIKPLIELKWATGINSNDCSNIPMMIKLIEDKGFRNKCIIMTSMKPCLEYIRTNYPDIELQFLTGQYWSNHFDWCVKWKIDADIQATYFDKSTVQRYHAAGLKVNMWTTNDHAGYLQYGNWGCDFITTDRLDASNLPALDPEVSFPENTIDYPVLDVPVKGNYTPEKVSECGWPEALAGAKVKRAMVRDGRWTVLAHAADGAPVFVNVDAESGATTAINTTGIAGGTSAISDFGYTADGVLVACNAADVKRGPEAWTVYRWTAPEAAPEVFLSMSDIAQLGGWVTGNVGASMAVSGRLDDLYLFTLSRNANSGKIYRVIGLQVKNGAVTKNICAKNTADYTIEKWGNVLLSNTPSSRDNIQLNSDIMAPVEYTFDWVNNGISMMEYAKMPEGIVGAESTGMSFFRRGNKVYAVIPDCSLGTARVYESTRGIQALSTASGPMAFALGEGTGHVASGIDCDSKGNSFAYIMAENRGLVKYQLDKEEVSIEPQDVALDFERIWINSRTTNNAPEHIDGTNAQQGTGVGGMFYVNDCSDKKVYVFDRTGCIGSMPGGAGWGTARDDKGNIVVRDDKLTGTEHSFIVYAAGSTPDNYGEPVRFSASVPLEGQTNFINASGDLLNGTGHIYLYPNKQTAVNIITVENGKVMGSKSYSDLKIAGSTAGYVVPLNDNSENWLYQVRGTGVYEYNGGASEGVSVSRASTTAPARNSTGGCAMFTLKGNRIFIHNSGGNYLGGFTVRNLSKPESEQVVTNVTPIGNIGYTTGGNYSTFNWLIPEVEAIDQDGQPYSYLVHQYTPANGMALYRLRDKNTGIDNVAAPAGRDAVMTAALDGNTLYLSGIAGDADVAVYAITGARVVSAKGQTVDVSMLPAGLYIVRASGKSVKFVK